MRLMCEENIILVWQNGTEKIISNRLFLDTQYRPNKLETISECYNIPRILEDQSEPSKIYNNIEKTGQFFSLYDRSKKSLKEDIWD